MNKFHLTNVQLYDGHKQEGCTFIPPFVAIVLIHPELFFCLLPFDIGVSQSNIQEATNSNEEEFEPD